MKIKYFHVLFFLFLVSTLAAQNTVDIWGKVTDTENRGIESVNVYIENSTDSRKQGTTTAADGSYKLTVQIDNPVVLVFSIIGYQTQEYVINPTPDKREISVVMQMQAMEMQQHDVVAHHRRTSTLETINIDDFAGVPNTAGGIESYLIAFSGVSSNNELSSQYNVRGGNFDENSVYINGVEVFRPLLIRSGQQEGLSVINPDMVGRLSFSSGGFDVEFGDKMSSVLDIEYKKPKKFESTVSVSLLGASAYLGTRSKKFTQMHGFRYKTSAYLLGTLDTKAEYKPSFIDYQTYLTYEFSPKWELTFLGNYSQNKYKFVPTRRETDFGTITEAKKLIIEFGGQEVDLFRTAFGALTLDYKPADDLKLSLQASAFHTNERETYDITGEYRLSDVDMDMDAGTSSEGEVLGIGLYHEHARNRLMATVASLAHRGQYNVDGHKIKWGANVQLEKINDKINEWEWRDSVGYSLPHIDERVQLYYNLRSDNEMASLRTQAYIQDTYKWDLNTAALTLTGGLRANYWSFNNEFLVSPRVSLACIPYWEKEFTFRFATGLYYQSPFYKEIRREIKDEETGNVDVQLNNKIKSPRSLHFLLGGDHHFRALGNRPFKFTTEMYLKLADRMISYSAENVNIRYSGINDSRAYTAGIDFKLFGELVPGTDSWVNLSLMSSKEKMDGTDKWTPRPNDQRYSFSMFFQDYFPTNPKYKVHLRFVWSDGLPYSAPRDPSYRAAFRSPAYRRVDIGASRGLVSGSDKIMNKPFFKHIESIWFNLEVLNLFDFNNVSSYYWVTDVYNNEWAAPNYLTERQFNFKITVDFK